MEVALIVFVCVYVVSAILDAFYKGGGTNEMIVAAVLFIVKCFIYLLLFGVCVHIVILVVEILLRLGKLILDCWSGSKLARWIAKKRKEKKAMKESCS